MILIALGANLSHPELGPPEKTLAAAAQEISGHFGAVLCSNLYRTAPVPPSDQPWFVNAVMAVESTEPPESILSLLHDIEYRFGRVRKGHWAARILDLDLLACSDLVTENRDQRAGLVLPHPRIEERAFVVRPLAEIAPAWRHPVSGMTALELLRYLPSGQSAAPFGPMAEPE